jgi:glutamate-1-semialdehyde 2,1-aminomutase
MGGGFSFGCFGGQKEITDQFDPTASSHFAHSGTYNNNVFTIVAGIAGSKLVTRCEISRINALGDRLRLMINQMGQINGTQLVKAVGFGSTVGLHFHNSARVMLRDFFYFGLSRQGILIVRRGFVMLNLMHTDNHVDAFIEAFVEVLHSLL